MYAAEEAEGNVEDLFGDVREGEAVGEVEEIDDEYANEDVAPKRISPDPGKPTQAQIDEHMIDHFPYRCWCEFCVRGKATGEKHGRGSGSSIPIIAFDYLFVTERGVVTREEMEADVSQRVVLKILVVKDLQSKAIFAHTVTQKGVDADGYAVVRLVEDIKLLGYTKVILKSDNEKAIVKLLQESLRRVKTEVMDQVASEHPPSYDSQSNGSIENAVKQVQGHLRTLKFSLEMRVKASVPATHAVVSWMVEHAAWLLTIRPRGPDGLTPYQRVRGRNFGKRLLEFGEVCFYKLPTKGPRHDERGKLAERWKKGVFLGFGRYSCEYLLWDLESSTFTKSRCHQKIRVENRWPADVHEKITGDAHSTYDALQPEKFEPGAELGGEPEAAASRKPQSINIRKTDWEVHGATPGCAKCSHAAEHGWGLSSGPHAPHCVERYTKLLAETEAGRERIRRAEVRRGRVRGGDAEGSAQAQPPPSQPQGGDPGEQPDVKHPLLEKFLKEREERIARGDRDEEYEPTDAAGRDEEMLDEPKEAGAPEDADMGGGGHDYGDVDILQPIMNMTAEPIQAAIKTTDQEVMELVDLLGGDAKRYRKQRRKQLKVMVSEFYSPPRVAAAAKLLPQLGVLPGFSLDLTTVNAKGESWDFSIAARREEARQLVEKEKPMLIVGSVMCKAFSTLQNLSKGRRDPQEFQAAYQNALMHLQFMCEIYEMQRAQGRYFLHEHPAGAMSWNESCVQALMQLEDVDRVNGDQCQYGQCRLDGTPIKKPTGWMSNGVEILRAMSKRCTGRGGACSSKPGAVHGECLGADARRAAIYPFKLCKAILTGIKNQLIQDGLMEVGVHGIQVATRLEDVEALMKINEDLEAPLYLNQHGKVYRDALTGQPLVPELVEQARRRELEYFISKRVWKKRPVAEARERTGKPPITVKWVDVNKGDEDSPNYRSRLVAREIRLPGEESIFAPTPPLEALRTVLSLAATDIKGLPKHVRNPEDERRTQVAVIDISRAYFNAKKDDSIDPTYVALPEEDGDKARGMCGLLQVHMYGTRAAADGWHGEYSSFLVSLGFRKGDASACVFRLPSRHLVTSVHGDDFTIAGPKCEIDWLKGQMELKYELTETGRIGPGVKDGKELKVLNRIVRWCPEGLEYEADPRQAERIVADLGLHNAKTVGTPGVKVTAEQQARDVELPQAKHTAFRGVAARGN